VHTHLGVVDATQEGRGSVVHEGRVVVSDCYPFLEHSLTH